MFKNRIDKTQNIRLGAEILRQRKDLARGFARADRRFPREEECRLASAKDVDRLLDIPHEKEFCRCKSLKDFS